MEVTSDTFRYWGRKLGRRACTVSASSQELQFRSLFGVTPDVCELSWRNIFPFSPEGSRPKHLLWALLLLKVYGTEKLNSVITVSDPKTFRKWAWTFVELIADMHVVRQHKFY